MAVINTGNQYKFSGRYPVDAKMLVNTYADLLSEDTWMIDNKLCAFNGMIVAVGYNNSDPSKNGVYYLHDETATTTFKPVTVTDEKNWHKICNLSDADVLSDRISAVEDTVNSLPAEVESYASNDSLPSIGKENVVYIVEEENATYRWADSDNRYHCIGREYEEIVCINGGSSTSDY